MASRKRGISPDLLIHPGETIADILEDRGLTQKELAMRAGVSEPFLSDVISGRKDISKKLAMGLEYALGVPSSFWLNLQANYDADLLSVQEEDTIQEQEKDVFHGIHEMVDFLQKSSFLPSDETLEKTIISLRKLFQISSLVSLPTVVPAGEFRIAGKAAVDPNVLGAWLCYCRLLGMRNSISSDFSAEQVKELVAALKEVMCNTKGDPRRPLTALFSRYGIDFSIVRHFHGAPVQGYIAKKEDESYQMVLTIRGAYADIFWFSLFHELGHIVNGDLTKPGSYIDAEYVKNQKKEDAADQFAKDSLLDPKSYNLFIGENKYSYSAIKEFAQTQNVPPFVVIGRMQKEKIIPWSYFTKYKPRFKWIEA